MPGGPGEARVGADLDAAAGPGVKGDRGARGLGRGVAAVDLHEPARGMGHAGCDGDGARGPPSLCGMLLDVTHRRLTLMTTSPTWTSSPSRSVTGSRMERPFTSVPFVELRSSSTSAGPWSAKRACVDETNGSEMTDVARRRAAHDDGAEHVHVQATQLTRALVDVDAPDGRVLALALHEPDGPSS